METPSTQPVRSVAPEDLKPDDYVTVLHKTCEYVVPRDAFSAAPSLATARVTYMPDDAGRPLKVVELCLPFVLVKDASGRHQTLDLRRYRLARLGEEYAKKAFKRLALQADKGARTVS